MTRAICTTFHKYSPFGEMYYQPIFDYFIDNLGKYKDEFEKLYIIDSNWRLTVEDAERISKLGIECQVENVNSSLRYYDAYKEVLPKVKEALVMLLDNDTVVYRKGVIRGAFLKLEPSLKNKDTFDVVSIYDTIGKTFDELGGKSKFCPYLFATKTNLLMQYRYCDWGPNMPHYETLGKLTEEMVVHEVKPYEMEEDKSNILINGSKNGLKGKDLGYYHVRAGSTPALLLAWRNAGNVKTYSDYLKNQPKTEYVRQIAWFWYMCWQTKNQKVMQHLTAVLKDADIKEEDWYEYFKDFVNYHNLPYEKNMFGIN